MNILLIEDNEDDTLLIQEMLVKVTDSSLGLKCVDQLSKGLEQLAMGGFDVVLLDLNLPDSQGLNTLNRVLTHAPEIPVVVLTGFDDETLAIKAVREGAQDYLIKGEIDNPLMRALHYAIERHRLHMAYRSMSLIDDLTGLYNRRGFLALVEQQLKLAQRTKRGFMVVFADLDGLKQINDTLGHKEGDNVLIKTADLLRDTFRESDIIARLGGDEYAVLAIEANKISLTILAERLQRSIKAYNTKGSQRYQLSLSVGMAQYDPNHPRSIDELLAEADALMYEHKQSRKRNRVA